MLKRLMIILESVRFRIVFENPLSNMYLVLFGVIIFAAYCVGLLSIQDPKGREARDTLEPKQVINTWGIRDTLFPTSFVYARRK